MKQISFHECLGPKREKKNPIPEDMRILVCCKAGNMPRKQTAVSCEFTSETPTEVHGETTVACGLVCPVFTVQGVCRPHLLLPHGFQQWGKVQHSSPHVPLGKLICTDGGLCRGGAGPPLGLPHYTLDTTFSYSTLTLFASLLGLGILLSSLLEMGYYYAGSNWPRTHNPPASAASVTT